MSDLQVNSEIGAGESAVKNMGFLKRLSGIIFSPGAVMGNLAERPRVLFGILASIFAMPLFYLLRFPLFMNELREKQLKAIPMMKEKFGYEMTPEMVEKQLPITAVSTIISYAFAGFISILLLALVFFAIFKIMGGQGKFKAYLSVTGYAYTIIILYFVVNLIASFFTGSLNQDMSLTSVANLLPQSMKGQFLYGAASNMDLFQIWYYAVIGIGMAAITKLKKKYVYGAVCIVFIIGMLIAGFSASAASAFM